MSTPTQQTVINLKIESDVKEQFAEVCRASGVSTSAAIRQFMHAAIRSSETGEKPDLPTFGRRPPTVTHVKTTY